MGKLFVKLSEANSLVQIKSTFGFYLCCAFKLDYCDKL